MIVVDNIPEEILKPLTEFSNWFFQQDRTKFDMRDFGINREEAVSTAYLNAQQQKGESLEGYPACAYGIDFQEMKGFDLDVFYPKITQIDTTIRNYLSAKCCAIKMYYPAGGFIDWHTNANAYGYNALFTYSQTGDGAFLYQDPSTKQIVELKDKRGWNMKVGLYDKQGGAPLWHAAYTECERLTWGYVIDQLGWDNLVEELNLDISPLEAMVGELPSFRNSK